MSTVLSIIICVSLPLTACLGTQGHFKDDANPYQRIVNRNVFGLESAIRIVTNLPVKVERPPIALTGLTTILGKKQALLTVQAPGKPVEYYILAEGERDGEIEVLQVDEVAGKVEVKQARVRITLTFDKNGVRTIESSGIKGLKN